jgi:hypothetical protein
MIATRGHQRLCHGQLYSRSAIGVPTSKNLTGATVHRTYVVSWVRRQLVSRRGEPHSAVRSLSRLVTSIEQPTKDGAQYVTHTVVLFYSYDHGRGFLPATLLGNRGSVYS